MSSFHANNTTGGDITLNNTAALLTITGISEAGGGNVTVGNTGNISTTTAAISTTANGTISVTASRALTVGAAVRGWRGTVSLRHGRAPWR